MDLGGYYTDGTARYDSRVDVECRECYGEGWVYDEECTIKLDCDACDGQGIMRGFKWIESLEDHFYESRAGK